jgi:hypothetical protein
MKIMQEDGRSAIQINMHKGFYFLFQVADVVLRFDSSAGKYTW